MLAGQSAARQAHLRSHSGHNSGCTLSHAPTTPEFTIQPHLFQVLLCERLRLPLFLTIRWGTIALRVPTQDASREEPFQSRGSWPESAGARVKFNA